MLLELYRLFAKLVVKLTRPFLKTLRARSEMNWIETPNTSLRAKRLWFHAASAGELESLWPIVRASAEASYGVAVSVFSRSAERGLTNLVQEIEQDFPGSLFAYGFSPLEGHWKRTLSRANIGGFVTAKYEAWPELWGTLRELNVPLTIVGAEARPSLQTARLIVGDLLGGLPEMGLVLFDDTGKETLSRWFPKARVGAFPDPRWERVIARQNNEQGRAHELVKKVSGRLSMPVSMPVSVPVSVPARPWGILGSVWPEDLAIWSRLSPVGRKALDDQTLWIVPHKIDRWFIESIEASLRTMGLKSFRTSTIVSQAVGDGATDGRVILVDEMGCLTELYAFMDWAYVGGGFSHGLHSTIEPAVAGLPIAGGPHRARLFSEVRELLTMGQLTLVPTPTELEAWICQRTSLAPEDRETRKQVFRGRNDLGRLILKNLEGGLPHRSVLR